MIALKSQRTRLVFLLYLELDSKLQSHLTTQSACNDKRNAHLKLLPNLSLRCSITTPNTFNSSKHTNTPRANASSSKTWPNTSSPPTPAQPPSPPPLAANPSPATQQSSLLTSYANSTGHSSSATLAAPSPPTGAAPCLPARTSLAGSTTTPARRATSSS